MKPATCAHLAGTLPAHEFPYARRGARRGLKEYGAWNDQKSAALDRRQLVYCAFRLRHRERSMPVAAGQARLFRARELPCADGIDTVPILILDKTQYIYAPPQSFHCLAANDVQLIGLTELPDSVGENTHVTVDGKVLEGVAQGQYTRFVIQVNGILPIGRLH